jgi:polyhydroxyalkanoate synthase subunit PhaC
MGMPSIPTPAEVRHRIRRDVERNALRARNGIEHVVGMNRAQVGLSPKEVVWRRDKAELWRYANDGVAYRPPVFIVMSLISRSYILDLYPGNSFIEKLVEAGFDVFLLDWGVPDEADADNDLERYVDEYLPRALEAARDVADTEDVTVLGYCLGGVLALLLAAAHPEEPIRNLVLMATPVDFQEMGMMGAIMGEGRLEPDHVIDATGNVPSEAIRDIFRLLKPTADVASYATLWQNLWNDEYVHGYQAFGQWTRDHIPFPGAAARQCATLFARRNAFMEGTLRLGGRPVDLQQITCPLLNVIAERDHIVPSASADPVIDLVGSEAAEELRLPAGHVALVAGRQAAKTTIPTIVDWLQAHSEAAAPLEA